MEEKSLQETYAPHNACFGCGPANLKGLHVRSFSKGEKVVAHWKPEPHYEAFPGVLNGGIVGAILDCHSNWTAAWTLMQHRKESHPPCTVTANYRVELLAPTPSDQVLEVVAWPRETTDKKVIVEAELKAGSNITAKCVGTFVAVKPGHPAYHRW